MAVLDIALDPSDLPGKAQAWLTLKTKIGC